MAFGTFHGAELEALQAIWFLDSEELLTMIIWMLQIFGCGFFVLVLFWFVLPATGWSLPEKLIGPLPPSSQLPSSTEEQPAPGGLNIVPGADLGGADLKDANLQGANLQGANLEGADLKDANLQGANLQGANLEGANLEGANLEGANLEGADLKDADLKDAKLQGINVEGANVEGTRCPDAVLFVFVPKDDDETDATIVDCGSIDLDDPTGLIEVIDLRQMS